MQSIVRRIRTIGNFENVGGIIVPPTGVDLARSFNGTSDFIDVGNSSVLNPASITVSCWVFWNGTYQDPGAEQWFVGRDDNVLGRAFALGLVASSPHLIVQINGAANFGGTTNSLPASSWAHIAFTGSSAAGYNTFLNGTAGTSGGSGTTMNSTTGDVTIGKRTYSGNEGFVSGNIADIAIWNTILTGTQISNLASGQRANTIGANANLVGYWPIVGQSPEPDKSGNSNNGVLTGTTIVAGPPSLQLF
jgi:Concanavalin A-like lectin/glucanases superfamily